MNSFRHLKSLVMLVALAIGHVSLACAEEAIVSSAASQSSTSEGALHLSGHANSAGTQFRPEWQLNIYSSLDNYKVRAGDKFIWDQFESSSVQGGLSEFFFWDCGDVRAVSDESGTAMQRGPESGSWVTRTVDLTAQVGCAFQILGVGPGNAFGAGAWDLWLANLRLQHADGSVIPIYTSSVHPDPALYTGYTPADSNPTARYETVNLPGSPTLTDASEAAMHLSGYATTTGTSNRPMWQFQSTTLSIERYVVRSGDKLIWDQLQSASVQGGLSEFYFWDCGEVKDVNDQNGIAMQSGTSANVWYSRAVDLSGQAGCTFQILSVGPGNSLTAGSWDLWLANMYLEHADGTVIPIYTAATHPDPVLYTGYAPNDSSPAELGAIVYPPLGSNSTNTTISASPSSPSPGQSVVAQAHVSCTTACGAVQFSLSGTNIGSPVPLDSKGIATITLLASQLPANAGSYPLVAFYPGSASNDSSSASINIVIGAADPTLTWAVPASITYGTPVSRTQLNAQASVPGVFNYSVASGAILGAGNQPLAVEFVPDDSAHYASASASVTLAVAQAVPVITWSPPPSISASQALDNKVLNASASVPGIFIYTPPAGTILPPGNTTLTASFSPTDSANYASATAQRQVTVGSGGNIIHTLNAPLANNFDIEDIDSASDLYFAFGRMYSVAANALVTSIPPPGMASTTEPEHVSHDASGNIYFTTDNSAIWRMDEGTGTQTQLAGNWTGAANYAPDGSLAITADLGQVTSLLADDSGNVYFTTLSPENDGPHDAIRMINASTGILSTIAGANCAPNAAYGEGVAATSACLNGPTSLYRDPEGNFYFLDLNNQRIRRVDGSTGVITTLVGNAETNTTYDFQSHPGTQTPLFNAVAMAGDAHGNLYFAEANCSCVREFVASSGMVIPFAGNGTNEHGGDGWPALSASLLNVSSVAVSPAGTVYIGERTGGFVGPYIRVIGDTPIPIVSVATPIISWPSPSPIAYGTPLSQIQLDASANVDGDFSYTPSRGTVLTPGTHTLSATFSPGAAGYQGVSATTTIQVTGGNPATFLNSYAGNPGGGGWQGDGGAATSALLDAPSGIATNSSLDLFIPDSQNCRIRKIDHVTGIISTVAGAQALRSGATEAGSVVCGYSGDGGNASAAGLAMPTAIAFDPQGNMYISDTGNSVIRKVDITTGDISTYAGNTSVGSTGDGGPATSASLNYPLGIAVDSSSNLYIAESNGQRIRKVTPSGLITTFAGTGTAGYLGDGGPASQAQLSFPSAIAIDGSGNVYIADSFNHTVRMVSSSSGLISTIAGNSVEGYSGDGGPATQAALDYPSAIALDASNNVYIADAGSNVIREVVSSTGKIATIVGTGVAGANGIGVPAVEAQLNSPSGLALGAGGTLYIADERNYRIVDTSVGELVPPTVTWPTQQFAATETPLTNQQLNATANIPGTFTYTPAAGTMLQLGTTAVKATFTPTDSINYATVTALSNIIVTAPSSPSRPGPQITWPAPAAITYGTPLSSMQLNATALLDGTFTYSPGAGTILDVGVTQLTVHYQPTGDPYTTSDAIVYLTVKPAPLSSVLLSSSANPSASPGLVTFKALVAGASTGIVTFYDGKVSLGSAPLINGTANLAAVSSLTTGAHSITAQASTDQNHVTTTSAPLAQLVVPPVTSVIWPIPRSITQGTALSSTQLNATVDIPGTMSYSPSVGTVLPAGIQTLSVTFVPTDSALPVQTASVNLLVEAPTLVPSIRSVGPAPAPVGSQVIVDGENFGDVQGASTVTFNGVSGIPTLWTTKSISVAIPAGAKTGSVIVTTSGGVSHGFLILIPNSCP